MKKGAKRNVKIEQNRKIQNMSQKQYSKSLTCQMKFYKKIIYSNSIKDKNMLENQYF